MRSAFRAHALLVFAESLLVAGSAGIATTAAALAAARVDDVAQRLCITLVVAALAGATWGLERIGDTASVARKLDRQRGLRGAVLTAFQAEAGSGSSELAALLGARISHELSAVPFLRTAARSSAALLALPCLSLALWSLAVDASLAGERSPSAGPSSPGSAVVGGSSGRLDALRDRADRLAASTTRAPALEEERRRIVAEAAALRARSSASAGSSADLEPVLRDLERRLDRVQASIPHGRVTDDDPGGTMAGPRPPGDSAGDGAMRDQNQHARATEAPSDSAGRTGTDGRSVERGVLGSRWWASRYDGVVDRWIAARRGAPETPPK